MKLRTTVQLSSAMQKKPPLKREDSFLKRFSTRQIPETQETVSKAFITDTSIYNVRRKHMATLLLVITNNSINKIIYNFVNENSKFISDKSSMSVSKTYNNFKLILAITMFTTFSVHMNLYMCKVRNVPLKGSEANSDIQETATAAPPRTLHTYDSPLQPNKNSQPYKFLISKISRSIHMPPSCHKSFIRTKLLVSTEKNHFVL